MKSYLAAEPGTEQSVEGFFNRLGNSRKSAYGILHRSTPENHSRCGIRLPGSKH